MAATVAAITAAANGWIGGGLDNILRYLNANAVVFGATDQHLHFDIAGQLLALPVKRTVPRT
jgi:hypothetical protein